MKLDTQPEIDPDLLQVARQLNNTSLHPEKQAALIIAQEVRDSTKVIADYLGEIVGRLDSLAVICDR